MPVIVKRARRVSRQSKTPLAQSLNSIQTPLVTSAALYSTFTPPNNSELKALTHVHAAHLSAVVPRAVCDKTIKQAIEKLDGVDFDTIGIRGVSGLLLGPILAHLMCKELFLVRKEGERSASKEEYEGYLAIKRFIIVDDLVSTYSTAVRIFRAIKRASPRAELAGILLYNDGVYFNSPDSYIMTELLRYATDETFNLFR